MLSGEANSTPASPTTKINGSWPHFHNAEWSARPEIVRQFGDERFVRFGYLQIVFERPDLLDEKTRMGMRTSVARRHISAGDGDVPWTPIAAARSRIEVMLGGGIGQCRSFGTASIVPCELPASGRAEMLGFWRAPQA
jgi:hypothetical protein